MKSVQKPNKFVVKETILVILNNYLFKDTGCSEMGHLGFGVVLDAGDSYRQTVLIGLEGALSRYM